jgi:hypothetical protein
VRQEYQAQYDGQSGSVRAKPRGTTGSTCNLIEFMNARFLRRQIIMTVLIFFGGVCIGVSNGGILTGIGLLFVISGCTVITPIVNLVKI